MLVPDRPVQMAMRMRSGHFAFVAMGMMFVMLMKMIVLKLLVEMFMFVPLGKVERQADRHERPGNHKLRRHRLLQQQDSEKRADERR